MYVYVYIYIYRERERERGRERERHVAYVNIYIFMYYKLPQKLTEDPLFKALFRGVVQKDRWALFRLV